MKRRILMLIFVCLIAQHSAEQSSNRLDIEGKLLALEHVGKLQATELKDLKMLNEILDENFVYVDPDGKLMDKSQLLNFVQSATSLRYQTSEMTVRSHGSVAIVTGLYTLNGLQGGKPLAHRARFVDIWFPKNGQWRMIASISTPLN